MPNTYSEEAMERNAAAAAELERELFGGKKTRRGRPPGEAAGKKLIQVWLSKELWTRVRDRAEQDVDSNEFSGSITGVVRRLIRDNL